MQDLIRQARELIENGCSPEEAYAEVTRYISDWGICDCTEFGRSKPLPDCSSCDGTGIEKQDELAQTLNLGNAWRIKWLRSMRNKIKRFDG